jgi:hypothetical protein
VVISILKTMMSKMRTMKPMTPPPAPYCHELPWLVVTRVSSAIAKDSSANCKRVLSIAENIIVVSMVVARIVARIEVVLMLMKGKG